MKKKILAAALAMTMMLGSSVGALASSTPNVTAPDASGLYSADLAVTSTATVPTVKLTVPTTASIALNPYEMGGKGQIVSSEMEIVNESDVAVAVNISGLKAVKGTSSEVVVSATPPTAALKTKSAFFYLEVAGTDGSYKDKYDSKDALQVAVTPTGASKNEIVTLEAGDTTEQKAKFKFDGALVSNPSKAWTASDTVDISVKFTFTPQVVEPTPAP